MNVDKLFIAPYKRMILLFKEFIFVVINGLDVSETVRLFMAIKINKNSIETNLELAIYLLI